MRMRVTLAMFAFIVTMTGCVSVPIMNVTDATVASATGKALSDEQVRGAIIRAGSALGWQIKDEGPNLLRGTLILRTHTAVVDIPYSSTSFSIKYRSSVNLDEKNGNIHKNYNGWIQNLTKGINAQLALL